MASWFRRIPADSGNQPLPPAIQGDVMVWKDGDDGLFVSGRSEAVEALVGRIVLVGGTGVVSTPIAPTEAIAVFATGFADGSTSGQYIRHTEASRALLEEHGAIPNGKGGFRSLVHDGKGIAGNLDWEVVNVGPERALAFQSAAIGLALRTAVKQVEVAVERVENKVDRIAAFLRAERLGHILGDRRTLERLVERVQQGLGLASTDWSSVATLGPAITQDLEKLRAHARSQITGVEDSWRPRGRAQAVEDVLGDDSLGETLALIVVAEYNFSLWQQLRIEHIKRHEPEHFGPAADQARATLKDHLDQDQALFDELRSVQTRILTPRNLDGLAMLQSIKLRKAGDRLESVVMGFAEHRGLQSDAILLEGRPSLRDSIEHIGGWTADRLEPVRGIVPRRKGVGDGDSKHQPELGESSDD